MSATAPDVYAEQQSADEQTDNIVTVRASSWANLFDCAMRWEAQNIRGVRMPSSGAAHLGTSLHASTAAFDEAHLIGQDITVDDAEGVLVDTLFNPGDEVDWEDSSPKKVEPIARKLHERYCREMAPTQDYAGVEVLCEALDVEVPEHGITVRLTGTTDRIRRTADGKLGIADLKSGKQAVNAQNVAKTKGHGPQLAVYELLAEASLQQRLEAPAEIIGLQTTNQARIGTGTVATPRLSLLGTDEVPGLIEIAASMFASGLFPPNPRSMLCSAKYCPVHASCSYHD